MIFIVNKKGEVARVNTPTAISAKEGEGGYYYPENAEICVVITEDVVETLTDEYVQEIVAILNS